MDLVTAGQRRVVFVTGEVGIGKQRWSMRSAISLARPPVSRVANAWKASAKRKSTTR